jgi:phosphate uptake regulator
VSASLVSAQSLVEVAKKEKERRKKLDAQGKQAFTEGDLRGGLRTPAARPSSSTTTPQTGGTAATPEGGETPAEPEQDPTKTESYWRERVAAVNKKIQDLEAKLQSPELTSDTRGTSRRQAAERDLAQARSEKQTIADEARRKGVPPGWLR